MPSEKEIEFTWQLQKLEQYEQAAKDLMFADTLEAAVLALLHLDVTRVSGTHTPPQARAEATDNVKRLLAVVRK